MIASVVNINDVSHAIQLALAPAFLLTALAGLLNVMTGRLARIIDRGRQLTEADGLAAGMIGELQQIEFDSLESRRHLAGSAITACTFAALLVCMVIAALFLEVLLGLQFKWFIGLDFTIAVLAMVVGLAYFLREVHLSTRTVRINLAASESTTYPNHRRVKRSD
ncbi:MAG: DUF2721 domain-containing protein [Ideonella sp.]